jgi:outer membrane immunogenic protein
MKYHLMIAAAVAGLSAPAYAQDVSGFRIEARAGWEQAGANATVPNPDYDEEDETSEEFLTASENDSGITFGGEIGYDVLLGSSFVVGAYAGADISDTSVCSELVEDDLACTGIDRTFTLGARAGVPLGETSLLYLKGGYSNGKIKTTYDADVTDNDDEEPDAIAQFSESQGGYHLGGGLELGLSGGFYGKVEYTYTDYGSRSYLLGDEDGDPALEVGASRHLVVAGVGLRF